MVSKTQIDRLGNRLRSGAISEDDLRMLDEYRRSFSESYEFGVGAIRNELGLEPTGRPAKSTTSISEKLQRESIRLSQIQDIAGCRLVVSDILEQGRVVESLIRLFEMSSIVDRRKHPSHGYRAIHVIVEFQGRLVEVQVRTALQHSWAELSEKLSDVVDPSIKYGGGSTQNRELLSDYSELITHEENFEAELASGRARLSKLLSPRTLTSEEESAAAKTQIDIDATEEQVLSLRRRMLTLLQGAIDNLPKGGSNSALSD